MTQRMSAEPTGTSDAAAAAGDPRASDAAEATTASVHHLTERLESQALALPGQLPEVDATRRGLIRRAVDTVARTPGAVRVLTDTFALVVVAGPILHITLMPVLLTFLGVMALAGLYSPQKGVQPGSLVKDLPRLAAACGVSALALLVIFPGEQKDFRYAAVVTLYAFVMLALGRGVLYLIASQLRRSGFGIRNTLIVGRGAAADTLMSKIGRHPETGLRVVGVVHEIRDAQHPNTIGSGPEDLPELVTRYSLQELILVPDDEDLGFVSQCFLAVDGYRVNASLVPPMRDFLLSPSGVEHIEGVPLISLGRLSYAPRLMPGKRLVDIIGATLALMLVSPILLATALAIRLDDRGPVFFRQRRAGYRGRYFRMFKFRSMCMDAEAKLTELEDQNETDGLLFKMKQDPRITRIGAFIRKTSIDELPQLMNVIRGDMSLVGPRALPVEVEHFGDLAIKRLNVRPGITGLWQVTGRSDLTYEEMVKLDLAYIQNWSLWADLVLMLRTVPVLLRSDGAY